MSRTPPYRPQTDSDRRATEELAPGQKKPEAAAPNLAVRTADQIEIATLGAPLEPPVPTQEQVAKRAALRKGLAALPEHLRLGVTLPGMRERLSQLPNDAVEQFNAQIPLDEKTGEPKYPKSVKKNGYVNQFFVSLEAKGKEGQPGDGLAVCERLQKQGSPHVGEATVFVSWFLDTPIATLLDALGNFLKEQGLREEDTFFWVCDYVIRQTKVETKQDLARLGDCVSAIGHTVLLMEPWHAPAPFKRAYCITEVYHTQKSGAQFDMMMSSAQQAAFEAALVSDFDSVQTSLSKVDVRTATCLKPEETKAILHELEQDVGIVECNTLVIGLLREALVAQARAALGRLPAAERGASALFNCRLGGLLWHMGKLKEARPVYEEALQARRETLGDRHPDTLISIDIMGRLLTEMGNLEEAKPLIEQALQGCKETLGDRHPSTLHSIVNMGLLLQEMGKLEEARPLLAEALLARRETLGDRHPRTLTSIDIMGWLLQEMGRLEEARPLYEEALQGCKDTLGDRHPLTVWSISLVGQLLKDMGKLEEARPLLEEALQASRETRGDRHPRTLSLIAWMGGLLHAMSQLEEARPLYEEALQGCKETLGDRHPLTLHSIGNMADLLRATGALVESEAVLGNAVAVAREVFGSNHMYTLVITAKAARLQHAQPSGAAAGKELLAATVARMAARMVLGDNHQQTSKYRKVLTEME